MSRATLVYIIMLVACAAGVWVILGVGSRLRAPTDISGRWSIAAPDDPGVAERLGGAVEVSQSGRFLHFAFERGPRVDVKLVDEVAIPTFRLAAAGGEWSLSASGEQPGGPLDVILSGPARYAFRAERLRAGEPDVAPTPVHAPKPLAAPTTTPTIAPTSEPTTQPEPHAS